MLSGCTLLYKCAPGLLSSSPPFSIVIALSAAPLRCWCSMANLGTVPYEATVLGSSAPVDLIRARTWSSSSHHHLSVLSSDSPPKSSSSQLVKIRLSHTASDNVLRLKNTNYEDSERLRSTTTTLLLAVMTTTKQNRNYRRDRCKAVHLCYRHRWIHRAEQRGSFEQSAHGKRSILRFFYLWYIDRFD
jgi:hypothetical protein